MFTPGSRPEDGAPDRKNDDRGGVQPEFQLGRRGGESVRIAGYTRARVWSPGVGVLLPLFIFELLGGLNLSGKAFVVVVALFIAFEIFRVRKFGARIFGAAATVMFYGVVALVLAALGVGAGWFDPNLGKIGTDIGRIWSFLLDFGGNALRWIVGRVA